MAVSEFIARCDRYCEAAGKSRMWLSKALLADTYWLQRIADGKSDIGARRLERAVADLEALEKLHAEAEASKAAA